MSTFGLSMPVDLVIGRRTAAAPAHTSASTTSISTASISTTSISNEATSAPMVSATISDLVAAEADLSYQAHLGDLHPTHATRLAAVTAELDRRWSTFC